jgi:hypothetical protein
MRPSRGRPSPPGRRSDVDDRLLSVVKEELLAPEAIVEVERMVREISASAASDQAKRKQTIAARLAELDREITNLVQAIAKVGFSLALEEGLFAAERERSELKQEIARTSHNPREMFHVVPSYKRFVMDLQNALARDPKRARAMLQEIFGGDPPGPAGRRGLRGIRSAPRAAAACRRRSALGLVAGGCYPNELRLRIK